DHVRPHEDGKPNLAVVRSGLRVRAHDQGPLRRTEVDGRPPDAGKLDRDIDPLDAFDDVRDGFDLAALEVKAHSPRSEAGKRAHSRGEGHEAIEPLDEPPEHLRNGGLPDDSVLTVHGDPGPL